ncbi:Hsp20/alpha crystallin family protein [Streptomyces sp. NPDC006971]|uniref:Hsp20/alpha crystallin family protein n=1 Tax=Streptomyces sp. NPDC006971 TaxID=3154784 RepID=UPI0034085752
MSGTHPERRHGRFPDLTDWFGTDFPRFPWRSAPDVHTIPIEMSSKEGQYTLRAELPGMDPEKDIHITVEGDTLTVGAEHAESKEEKSHSEFRYGSFHRTVRLPARIPPDGVEAEYEDGILTMRVTLESGAAQAAHRIPVKRITADGPKDA